MTTNNHVEQMRSPKARVRAIAALACGVVALAGCESDPSDPDAPWRNSADPVSVAGLPWAAGSTVHLESGDIDVGETIATFVVAGDGVYFTEDDKPEDGHVPRSGEAELRYADRDGAVVDTDVTILVHTLSASPDGRYLAALDAGSGEKDQYGTPQAQAVVWDLKTGEEVLRSTEGMGDPEEDDFADLYPELDQELDIVLPARDKGYLSGVGGTWSIDLATGTLDELDEDEPIPAYDVESLSSPDGAWSLNDTDSPPVVTGPGGAVVVPKADPALLRLYGWVDARTLYGVLASSGSAGATVQLCVVPEGTCSELGGSAGKHVIFPNDAVASGGVVLGEL